MINLRIIPDVITKQVIYSLSETDSALDGANLMVRHDISAVVVYGADNKLVGIVTERDLTRRVLADELDPGSTPLSEIMTDNPDTLSPDDAVHDALELMRTRRYRHLPVMKNGQVLGMVSIRDIYEAVQNSLEQSMRETEALVFSGEKDD